MRIVITLQQTAGQTDAEEVSESFTCIGCALGRYGKKQPRPVGLFDSRGGGKPCGLKNQINRLTGYRYPSSIISQNMNQVSFAKLLAKEKGNFCIVLVHTQENLT